MSAAPRASAVGSKPPWSKDAKPAPALTEEETKALRAEDAVIRQEWTLARELWQELACAVPQNRHYRAQLGFSRAGELLAAGDAQKSREELERVLRLDPAHPGAKVMMKATRTGRISRLLLGR